MSTKLIVSNYKNFKCGVKLNEGELVNIRFQPNEDVQIGDIVLTSNLSIYFPPNLPVGEVISFYKRSNSSNKIVRMRLFSDLSTLNQLFILRGDS